MLKNEEQIESVLQQHIKIWNQWVEYHTKHPDSNSSLHNATMRMMNFEMNQGKIKV